MTPQEPGTAGPHPRESFGHPVTAVGRHQFSDHKAGHDESPPPSTAEKGGEGELTSSILPAYNPTKVPRTSLSARIRERLAKGE